jgi:hypothetical protein
MVRSFLEIVERSQVAAVSAAIEAAVGKSFRDDSARMTRDEVRRRFEICERIFRTLRGELAWGLQRVLDRLPYYLRCELDGKRWEPDRRTIWMPGDGA